VIEIAKELIEAMHRGQKLVAVAKMILAELPGHIAEGFQQIGQCWVLLRQPFFRSWKPDL